MAFQPRKNKDESKERTKSSINIPILDVSDLPSNWITYPPNSSIKVRRYTFGEIDKFNQSTLNIVSRIDLILEGIITSFDKDDLTIGDYLYLALYRKLFTFGDGVFSVKVGCPKCGKVHTFNVKTKDIDFNTLNLEKLPIVLTMVDGTKLSFSPLTIRDLKSNNANNRDINSPIVELASQVRNMSYDEAYDIIYHSSNVDDENALREIQKYLDFGAKNIETKCINKITVPDEATPNGTKDESCDQLISVDLQVEREDVYIYPFREFTGDSRATISFGEGEHS